MTYRTVSTFLLLWVLQVNIFIAQSPHHHNGHSHNDYEQDIPLHDALKYGYTSIEVDIQYFNGKLVVAHDPEDLASKPSLRELYLSPLDGIINANDGTVFEDDSTTVILMIDLKEQKELTLPRLASILDDYKKHLYQRKNNEDSWGPIKIILSGDPPLSTLEELNRPYFFIDGRVEIVYPASLESMVDRISASYALVWNATDTDESIRDLVKWCSESDRKLRFWATPDKPQLWQKLNDLKVDWISVDNLEGYRDFYYNDLVKEK